MSAHSISNEALAKIAFSFPSAILSEQFGARKTATVQAAIASQPQIQGASQNAGSAYAAPFQRAIFNQLAAMHPAPDSILRAECSAPWGSIVRGLVAIIASDRIAILALASVHMASLGATAMQQVLQCSASIASNPIALEL